VVRRFISSRCLRYIQRSSRRLAACLCPASEDLPSSSAAQTSRSVHCPNSRRLVAGISFRQYLLRSLSLVSVCQHVTTTPRFPAYSGLLASLRHSVSGELPSFSVVVSSRPSPILHSVRGLCQLVSFGPSPILHSVRGLYRLVSSGPTPILHSVRGLYRLVSRILHYVRGRRTTRSRLFSLASMCRRVLVFRRR
jgi:hypothetical protein